MKFTEGEELGVAHLATNPRNPTCSGSVVSWQGVWQNIIAAEYENNKCAMIMSDLKLNPTSLYSNTFNFQQIMFKYASLYIVNQ